MSWKNQHELILEYTDSKFIELFTTSFAVSYFLERGIVDDGYTPPQNLDKTIVLTESGNNLINKLKEESPDTSLSDLHLAVFIKFYHQDLFVDIYKSDIDYLKELLSNEITAKKIKFPWVYARDLYDRFFSMFDNNTNSLSASETLKLIDGAPAGVFQLSDILIGPFGVLKSTVKRSLQPMRSAALWHCSDPSCNALHTVNFSSFSNKVSEAVSSAKKISSKNGLLKSEWYGFFQEHVDGSDFYNDLRLNDLPWLIANSLSDNEIHLLTANVIDTYSKKIRPLLPPENTHKKLFASSGEGIASGITKSESLQLILILSNEEIATSLETLIDNNDIHIPATESRTAIFSAESNNWYDVITELSSLGVRSLATREPLGLIKLKRLIHTIYNTSDDISQLEWLLRRQNGENINEKLDDYLHSSDPDKILEYLIFSRHEYLQRAFSSLKYGNFSEPHTLEQEDLLRNKILWKLGFDIRSYPENHNLFWKRLNILNESAKSYIDNESDPEKEVIRAAAVNFFVSLEEILAESLYFSIWVLFSDHYGETRYKYTPETARIFSTQYLIEISNENDLHYDIDGKTTLYPLIRGFSLVSDLCSEISEFGDSICTRDKDLFPGYYSETDLDLFLFKHRILLLDLNPKDNSEILNVLTNVTTELEKSKVCDIRNRLQHRREKFPKSKEILEACEAIKNTVNKLESTGLSPLVYNYSGMQEDKFGRKFITLRNYSGDTSTLRLPSQYRLCTLDTLKQPQIVVPSINIGDTSDKFRFIIQEQSEYTDIWEDYPMRKERVSNDDTES